MDPSEFEGTVVQENDVLNAGSLLEEFFGSSTASSYNLKDYESDINDLKSIISKTEEYADKWKSISYQSQLIRTDDTLKVIELKEEYLVRRKSLAKTVKTFVESLNHESNDNGLSSNDLDRNRVLELIEIFKIEFDYIANGYKYVDNLFLSLYKILRDLPDPNEIFPITTQQLNKSYDIIKKMHNMINSGSNQGIVNQVSTSNTNNQKIIEEYESKIRQLTDEFESRYDKSIVEKEQMLSSFYEKQKKDFKSMEEFLIGQCEQKTLQIQEHYEKILASKDSEIISLISSLDDMKHKILEANEKEKTMEHEIRKRNDLEEKIQMITSQLLERIDEHQIMARAHIDLENKCKLLQDNHDKETKTYLKEIKSLQENLQHCHSSIERLESDLCSRPPIDFTQILLKLSKLSSSYFQASLFDEDGSIRKIPWETLEDMIIDSSRKSNKEAIEARASEKEIKKNYDDMKNLYDQMVSTLNEKNNDISKLENDLSEVCSAIRLKRPSTVLYGIYDTFPDMEKFNGSYVPSESLSDASSVSTFALASASGVSVEKFKDGYKILANHANSEQILQSADARMDDCILSLVENQRDRYMKAAKEMETSYIALKSDFDQLEIEQRQLKDENVALFSRLRYANVYNQQSPDVSDGLSNNINGLKKRDAESTNKDYHSMDISSQRLGFHNSDNLQEKYIRLYEEKLDPMNLQELDRQELLTRLNIAERSLAYIIRMFLHDPLLRKLMIFYIILIHIFALGYVIRVLNPELIDEVDEYAKAAYAKETLDIYADREHPDI